MFSSIRIILIFLFVHTGNCIYAATEIINVEIYRKGNISALSVSAATGSYSLIADGKEIAVIDKTNSVELFSDANSVVIKHHSKEIGKFKEAKIIKKNWGSSFKIKPTSPMLEERIYFDNLYIVASSGILRTINNVYIENYIAGVIESEAGSKQNLEYYKVQAIICRTYALSNLRRHQQEGFNLCDQVHCQVYKSKNRFNPEITKATNETKGFVVVDSDINLINASFHSNCGGQTVNAEDAWKYPLPYLRSVCDTFCSAQPHAYWSTVIPKKSWLGYLEKKHNFPVSDSTHLYYALNYSPIERNNYFSPISDSTLMLKTLRNDWQLRSTYFHITPHEDTIHITGSGFGHGVGLCQEGAMKMSECGYSYTEILHYYYTGVHVISLSALNFFREE